ncbi:MAG: bifunctional 5,10-methylenetetrahydrofolate dehydrogenase/5,10-methenyltetrahydrofolate cyclohydrolase [Acidobacteriota bacterium]
MTARRLDGEAVAGAIRAEVAGEVAALRDRAGAAPRLAAILVGDDPASRVYVRNKIASCSAVGIRSEAIRLPADAGRDEILEAVRRCNADDDLDAILVQLPLPRPDDRVPVILEIDPAKDVDGLHPLNAGRLMMRLDAPAPCTPTGIIDLLDRSGLPIAGQRAVIIGRSDIVGRPLAQMLTHRDATVTLCHSKTRDLPAITRQADLLIAAVGRPAFVRAGHIRPGATVIDVGINRVVDHRRVAEIFGPDSARAARARARGYALVGDVHPLEAERLAGHLTPVPGGIGPLTIACLLRNTLRAARIRREGVAGGVRRA